MFQREHAALDHIKRAQRLTLRGGSLGALKRLGGRDKRIDDRRIFHQVARRHGQEPRADSHLLGGVRVCNFRVRLTASP